MKPKLKNSRTIMRTIGLAFGLAVVAAACGDSTDTAPAAQNTEADSLGELLPFSQVQATEFEFEADETNLERGIFRVVTTEPMICTIVWGETDEFGNFNNSIEMNGTGIINHNVFLPGAEAGKEYKFRVQGSTANGDQFRSPIGTFTIPVVEQAAAPAGEEMMVHGANLALTSSVVEVSSMFSASWSGDNAIDGDSSTEWATQGDGDEGSITIDLGSAQAVVGVEFITRSMADGSAITDEFTITVDDGETFGPFPAGNLADPRLATVAFTGQIVRFDVATSTGGNVGAVEVRVFAPLGDEAMSDEPMSGGDADGEGVVVDMGG